MAATSHSKTTVKRYRWKALEGSGIKMAFLHADQGVMDSMRDHLW
jgi:hypothetical protein